nr:uncharacterized protein LOC113805087 [Penaeus vannamei]
MGAAGYFHRHIKDHSKISAPLSDLTKKNSNLPFEIHTDASQLAVCLSDPKVRWETTPFPILVISLEVPEIRYSATELGALPIIEAIKAFHPYIYGRKFHVYTDHKPLVYIFKDFTSLDANSFPSIEGPPLQRDLEVFIEAPLQRVH